MRVKISEYYFMQEDSNILQPNMNSSAFSTVEKEKYLFSRNLDQTIYKAVLYHLETKRVFLNPKLSLKSLSLEVGTNTTYLSNVINNYFNCNFKTLINRYRIEHCQKLLEVAANNEGLIIKEIYSRCGFLSSSAFYDSFKEFTGTTPRDYYNKHTKDRIPQIV